LPQPARRKLADKVLIDLIEADVDIGFGLVDEATCYRASGQAEFSMRALHEAGAILADIEQRIQQLGQSESTSFLLLVVELRREIEVVEREV
jgi:hypothetical protein